MIAIRRTGLRLLLLFSVLSLVESFPKLLSSCGGPYTTKIEEINAIQNKIEQLRLNLGLNLSTLNISAVSEKANEWKEQIISELQLARGSLYLLYIDMNIEHVSTMSYQQEKLAVHAKGVTDSSLIEIIALFEMFDKSIEKIFNLFAKLCIIKSDVISGKMKMINQAWDGVDPEMMGIAMNYVVSDRKILDVLNTGPCFMRIAGFHTILQYIDSDSEFMFQFVHKLREILNECKTIKSSTINELKTAIPGSIRTAVFSDTVCIRNVQFQERLIGDLATTDALILYTWRKKDVPKEAKWTVRVSGDGLVQLVNAFHKRTTHYNGNESLVLEPIADSVRIKTVSYFTLVADEMVLNDQKRLVSMSYEENDQTLWIIEKC